MPTPSPKPWLVVLVGAIVAVVVAGLVAVANDDVSDVTSDDGGLAAAAGEGGDEVMVTTTTAAQTSTTGPTTSTTSTTSSSVPATPTTARPAPPTSPPPTHPPATSPPTTRPPAAPIPSPTPSGTSSQCEATMVQWINQERAKAGRPALASDGVVADVARTWSTHMATTGALSHQNMNTLLSQLEARAVRENVGRATDSASTVFSGFMNSTQHRANILATDVSRVGVGCVITSSGYWVTQDFVG